MGRGGEEGSHPPSALLLFFCLNYIVLSLL
jgi:hypothetical protein